LKTWPLHADFRVAAGHFRPESLYFPCLAGNWPGETGSPPTASSATIISALEKRFEVLGDDSHGLAKILRAHGAEIDAIVTRGGAPITAELIGSQELISKGRSPAPS
jgi:hypothetical protein